MVGAGRRARAARAAARAAAAPHARATGAAGTLRLRGVEARRLLAPAAGLLPQTPHRRGARPHRRAQTRSRPVFHQNAGRGVARPFGGGAHAADAVGRRELGPHGASARVGLRVAPLAHHSAQVRAIPSGLLSGVAARGARARRSACALGGRHVRLRRPRVGLRTRQAAPRRADAAVRHQRRPLRRAQVAAAATGAPETAGVRASGVRRQHAVSRRPRYTRHEHRSTLHESPRQQDSRPPGEQQLLLDQHQHRSRRLRVVRRAGRVLGRRERAVREARAFLSARLVVAQPRRIARARRARVPVHAAARRPGLGERRVRALGAGDGLVQQHRMERGPAHRAAVLARAGSLRMEQGAELQVDRADGAPHVEPGPEHPRVGPAPPPRHAHVPHADAARGGGHSERGARARRAHPLPRARARGGLALLRRLRARSVARAAGARARAPPRGALPGVRAPRRTRPAGLPVPGGAPHGRAGASVRRFHVAQARAAAARGARRAPRTPRSAATDILVCAHARLNTGRRQ